MLNIIYIFAWKSKCKLRMLNVRHWQLIEHKVYKRRRKNKYKKQKHKSQHTFKYFGKIKNMSPLIMKELDKHNFLSPNYKHNIVVVPHVFSFKENFNESILFFKELLSSFLYGGDVIIDFSQCQKTSIANFSLLDLLLLEFQKLQKQYNVGLYYTTHKNIKVLSSLKDKKTNKYLHAFKYHPIQVEEQDNSYFLPLYLQRGKSRKKYMENQKSIVCARIVNFVNESFHGTGSELNEKGVNAIEQLITEVLSNAEDHSIANSEWYVNGISFLEIQHDITVVELNLAIINIGLPMYEGFEATKEKNNRNYKKVEAIYNRHELLFTPKRKFEKESLFMLYMLNEGISRLKYLESSRGNGTMQFIEAFIALGCFGENNPNFNSQLNIISGHSVLTCDNKYKPYTEGTFKKLSLNKENTLSLLPDTDYLHYNSEYFPGTILECKIYLNREHFNEILNKNGE